MMHQGDGTDGNILRDFFFLLLVFKIKFTKYGIPHNFFYFFIFQVDDEDESGYF